MKVSEGKWTIYKLMQEEERLSLYLPKTQLFSKKSFNEFLGDFSRIVFKPCRGRKGKGVIQVASVGKGLYELHEEFFKTKVKGRRQLYDYLMKRREEKGAHILQQNIELATINDNRFHIRVMVQRKKNSPSWAVTGRIVIVAAKGFFITNAAKELLTFEEAFDICVLKKRGLQEIASEINEISLLTATHLGKYYPRYRAMGIDVVMDHQEKVWIIEANLHPGTRLFNRLEDKSMFRTIKDYLRSKE